MDAIFETVDERIGQAAADFGVTMVASMLNGAGRSRMGRDLLAALKKFLDATLPWTPSADVLYRSAWMRSSRRWSSASAKP
ncbi:hypothetical protein, partial [Clostridium perfringens]